MTWRNQRDCGTLELYWRKAVSSLLYFRWYRWQHPDQPFYTPGAIRFLDSFLRPEFRVFEFGSGLSSLWFARRVAEYVAVEHDAGWWQRMNAELHAKSLTNAHIIFEPNFERYVRSADTFDEATFDIVAVDGRNRMQCLRGGVSLLKSDGILIFDDSQRPRYREHRDILRGWQVQRFDFGLQQTSIYCRT